MKNRIFINLLLIEIFIIGVCIRIIYSQMHVSESVLNQMVSRKLYMVVTNNDWLFDLQEKCKRDSFTQLCGLLILSLL
jgi:hypothetical protein